MQRKFLSTKEFHTGLTSLLKTASYNTSVKSAPSFVDSKTNKYVIPEEENTDLGQLAEESVPFFSNLFNQDTNLPTPKITEAGLYAEIMDGVS